MTKLTNTPSRFFYIEGPDGTGKTTLIDRAIIDGDVRVHNGPFGSRDEAYDNYMEQYAKAEESLFLCPELTVYVDRGPISEIIYGDVLRREPPPDARFHKCIEELNNLNATIIICLPKYSVAKENWSSRLDDEYVKREIEFNRIYNKYQNVRQHLQGFKGEVIFYDYTEFQHEYI